MQTSKYNINLMANHNIIDPMSEAAEMYLLRIALLSQNDSPVPISQLAETLEVSPISANQMCRKLEAKGLVDYQPYKGVTLTSRGEAIALRVLRKRRLWEVFLSEKLGLSPNAAEDIACRFEHVTPGELAEKLAEFLGHPILSPQRQPIPPGLSDGSRQVRRPLTTLGVGQQARVVKIIADNTLKTFLQKQRLGPGAEIKLLAAADDQAILLEAAGQYISLSFDTAQKIDVIPINALHSQPDATASAD